MKLNRTLSAFSKRKFVVSPASWGWNVTNPANGHQLHFSENGRGSGVVMYFTLRDPQTDSSVDLFMDSYFHTVKSALNYLSNEKQPFHG